MTAPVAWNPATNPQAQQYRPMTPATTAAPNTSTFGQGNNLLSTQVNPAASGRLSGMRSLADYGAQQFAGQNPNMAYRPPATASPGYQAPGAAAPGYQAVAGPNFGGARAAMGGATSAAGAGSVGGFGYGADTSQVRGMTLAQLQKSMEGPDRAALAGQTYDQLAERSRPEFEQRVRSLGQNTAALGRVGSGIYGSQLTDINQDRERELGLSRKELATSAAGLSLQDKLDQLNAARGVGSDFSSQDLNAGQLNQSADIANLGERDRAFGRSLSLADMERGMANDAYGANVRERDTAYGAGRDRYGDATRERDTAYGAGRDQYGDSVNERNYGDSLAADNFDRGRSQFTTLADYANGIGADERADRNELRGERDFQYGSSRDAQRDREAQWNMEQQAADRDWSRTRDRYDMAQGLGFGNDPSRAYQFVSGNLQQSGQQGMQGLGDTLGEYMYRQSLGTRPTTATSNIRPPAAPVIPQFELPPVRLPGD